MDNQCVCVGCEINALANAPCRDEECWGDGPGGTYLNAAGVTQTCMCAATGHSKVPALVREFAKGKRVINATDVDNYVAQRI